MTASAFRDALAAGADLPTLMVAHDAVVAAALASGVAELVSYATPCMCMHRLDVHRDPDLRVCRYCDCPGFRTGGAR